MTKKFYWLTLLSCFLMIGLMIGPSTPAVAGEEPQYGGTLKVANLGAHLNPISWDIAEWTWKHGHDTGLYMEHLFMGDLQKGPRGTNEYAFAASAWIPPTVMRGELVESYEVKKDPLALVFHLRKGVYWQEKKGVMKRREFTADDVVYAQNRLKNSRKAIPTYVDWVEKWVARDRYTAVAYLSKWNANWAYRFGWGYYDAIQAPEQEQIKDGKKVVNPKLWKNATGTGPYMVTDVKKGHSVTYTKNPDYWDTTPIGGKKYKLPFTDEIKTMLIKDRQMRISALRTGKIDMNMQIAAEDVAGLKKSVPQLLWSKYLGMGGYMVALRMDTKPFDDIRVRRALNLAVNQQEIIDTLYNGEGQLVNYPFPITFKSVYTPYKDLPKTAQELFTYNPEKAKKMLTEAGYPNGFTFKAQIPNSTQIGLDVGAMVVAYLAKVGVKLELQPMDYPSYLSMMLKKKQGPGYFFSNDHGNPFATIRKNFVTGQTWNPYMMADKHIDDTFFKTIVDQNLKPEEAYKIMKGLAVYAMDLAPAIWLPGGYVYVARWPWVKNYFGEVRVGAWRSGPIFARVWIDQRLKKKMGYK
ncbi:MAG: ABC transporter substrate-binding protein [Deltaproteobacteria bacterium]|nr:ABC transporter substrate-binding protein [Deltaproteobacteria bacterium]